ncbi:MAG TPA: hypothetical protein VN721_04970 [Flavipsychrobacter sp.]|nr:hypothetical protein [Flavipsychrobacter sp.]
MRESRIKKLWTFLVGHPRNFTMENRAFNSVSIITLLLLIGLMPFNIFIHLYSLTLVIISLIIIQSAFYYYSRFKKKFQISIILYAIISYVALIVFFYLNSGINGPIIFTFFITFQLLTAFTPNKIHPIWLTLHILIGVALLMFEFFYPNHIQYTYWSRKARFLDVTSTYVFTIAIIYCITAYLRNYYKHEKKVAAERAKAILEQGEKLQEIAWIQSHKVRSHVATILGLIQLFNKYDANDPINKDIIEKIKEASSNLDVVIKEIVAKTNEENDEDEPLHT